MSFLAQRPAQPPAPPPLPPAEVVARWASEEETTRAVAQLVSRASKVGWQVEVLYARGPWSMDEMADMLCARFFWDDVLRPDAVATWYRRKDKWEFESGMLHSPLVRLNSIELGKWLVE